MTSPLTTADLLGWLHENPFYPNRRRQALWYAFKYLQGTPLQEFARYAKSISYAFSTDDLDLLDRVIKKAGFTNNGIGQAMDEFAEHEAYHDPDLTGGGGGGPGVPSWMQGGGGSSGSDEQIMGLGDPDLDPDLGGDTMQGGNPGGSGYLGNIVAGVVSGLVSGARGAGTIPVGTRNQQNPDYVWNGQAWIYSPTTAGTTAAPPSAAQTQVWQANGQLYVGARTATGWTWNGQNWVPSQQYTTATPYYTPTVAKTDNTALYLLLLGGLFLLTSKKRRNGQP